MVEETETKTPTDFVDTTETFPKEMRERIESVYREMWAEKMKWLEAKKKEEQP